MVIWGFLIWKEFEDEKGFEDGIESQKLSEWWQIKEKMRSSLKWGGKTPFKDDLVERSRLSPTNSVDRI